MIINLEMDGINVSWIYLLDRGLWEEWEVDCMVRILLLSSSVTQQLLIINHS